MKHRYSFLFVIFSIISGSFFNAIAQERIASLQEPFVVLLDPADGTILDPTFIDLTTFSPGTPKSLLQVNDEIWIADQLEDRIDRFDLTGAYLSTVGGQISGGGLDNVRGMELVNGTEVWVTNAGSNNDAPGNSIIRFDLDGNNLGFFLTTGNDSTFDIIDVGGEVYISYISTESKIERRAYDGTVLGNIVEEGVVQFIQQMEQNVANSSLYAAVFSSSGSNGSGLYEFSETDGSILNYWGNQGSLRGVATLEDGNILISNGSGVYILDTTTGATTSISSESGQFFGRLDFTQCTTPPTPTGDAVQALAEGATIEDIVVDPTDVTWFANETDAMNGTNPLPAGTVLTDGATYYAVSIVDDCLSEPLAVTVNIILGLNDFNFASVKIYPNPTSDQLYIETDTSLDVISVYNLLGQELFSRTAISQSTVIDMSGMSPGVYVLTLTSEGQQKMVQIIKTE